MKCSTDKENQKTENQNRQFITQYNYKFCDPIEFLWFYDFFSYFILFYDFLEVANKFKNILFYARWQHCKRTTFQFFSGTHMLDNFVIILIDCWNPKIKEL